MRDLDEIQDEAIDAVLALHAQGVRTMHLDWATGTGKTVLSAKLARRRIDAGAGRILFLAERTELLQQTRDQFAEWADLDVAIEQGTREARDAVRYGGARVVAASVASLHDARLARWEPDTFSDIVVDEAHHHVAGSRYDRIVGHFRHDLRVCLTATPDRHDGQRPRIGLRAHRYPIASAIRDGNLLPLRVRKCATSVDLRGLRSQAGDWSASDVDGRVLPIVEPMARAAVATLSSLDIDRFVGFTPSVQSAYAMADALTACGIPTEAIHGDDPLRAIKLAMLDQRQIRGIINCATLTEGWDKRYLGAMLHMRPTQSLTLLKQMVGRITRPWPDMPQAWVIEPTWTDQTYDFAGVSDVLADLDEPEEVRVRARARVEDGAADDPLAALDDARAELSAAWEDEDAHAYKGRLTLGVKPGEIRFRHLDFDPVGVTVTAEAARRRDERARFEPIRRAQREQLKALGLPHHPLATRGMSRSEAQALIDLWRGRRDGGLATHAQVRELEGLIGPRAASVPRDRLMELSASEAAELLSRPLIAQTRWNTGG